MFIIDGKKYYDINEMVDKLENEINKTYEKFKFIKYEDAFLDSKQLAGEAFIEFLEFMKDYKFLDNDFFDTIGHEYYWYMIY